MSPIIKNSIQVFIKHKQYALLLSTTCSVVSSTVDTVETDIVRTDQYAKRNADMVTGIDYKRKTETFTELVKQEPPSCLNREFLFLRLTLQLVIEMVTELEMSLVIAKLSRFLLQ